MDQKPAATAKKPSRDDDDDKPPLKVKNPGLLSTALSRSIVISAVLACLFIATPLLLVHRYQLAPALRGDNALVFRIDTLTGRMSLCTATQCTPIAEKDKE